MPSYVVLLGPPGAGKGTQAQIVAQDLNLAHVSSGDLFRENLKAQTELGKLAKQYMDRGELVPDDVTIAMVKDRLSRKMLQRARCWMVSRAPRRRQKPWQRCWQR
jgi:adenylate kinase